MTEKLPLYVVKCFEAAGFDTLEVIAEMNIGNEPGNSIEQIEHFITDQFPNNPEYQRGKKFPPGHKIRIQRFVEEVKNNQSRKSQGKGKKRPLQGGVRNGPKKVKTDESSSDNIDQVNSVGEIRRQIVKWQRLQTDSHLKELKEHVHFQVNVTCGCNADVTCRICSKKFQLGTKNNRYIISNWTRHIINCAVKGNKSNHSIREFTSPSPVPSSSEEETQIARKETTGEKESTSITGNDSSTAIEKFPVGPTSPEGIELEENLALQEDLSVPQERIADSVIVAEKSCPSSPDTLAVAGTENVNKEEASEVQSQLPFRNAPPASQMRQEGN